MLGLVSIDIPIDVGVAVNIDVDIAAAPVTISPCITPRCAHGDSRAERKHRCSYITRRIIVIRRGRRIGPCAVDNRGIVGGYVNYLRICRFNLDDLFLDNNGLLLGGLEIAGRLRLGA